MRRVWIDFHEGSDAVSNKETKEDHGTSNHGTKGIRPSSKNGGQGRSRATAH